MDSRQPIITETRHTIERPGDANYETLMTTLRSGFADIKKILADVSEHYVAIGVAVTELADMVEANAPALGKLNTDTPLASAYVETAERILALREHMREVVG